MKQIFILQPYPHGARIRCVEAINKAPDGYQVVISEPVRNSEQNARLWSILNEIAEQVEWYGVKLSAEDYKHLLTAGLKKEQRVAPGIDGGFVVLGQSTRSMTKSEFSDLIEFAQAFAVEHGVRLAA